jgi:hypothetical protein
MQEGSVLAGACGGGRRPDRHLQPRRAPAVAAGGADNEARARELYLRCLDDAEAGERVWGPTCRNLASPGLDGQNDAHKREAVERALDSAVVARRRRRQAVGRRIPGRHLPLRQRRAGPFLALADLLQRASEIDPEYVDVVRMAPLINGEGRWFGASRARKQQAQDRQQVDSATWA